MQKERFQDIVSLKPKQVSRIREALQDAITKKNGQYEMLRNG